MVTLPWGGTKVWTAPLPLGCYLLEKLGQGMGWRGRSWSLGPWGEGAINSG